ncbi:hypothetical protein ACT3TZ_06820 [Brachybacterium sp. AOP25-B2-12]|uniref:hypothetical protein n=1 Tax=Brachybacterium sp. AOP25-B2-12 TaxID=3457710 RepID=UPI0040335DCE
MTDLRNPVDTAVFRLATAHPTTSGDDRDWAERAAGILLLDDVDPPRVAEAITDAASEVERSGASPTELYGDPTDWVRHQQESWREQGIAVKSPHRYTARDVVIESLLIGCVFAVLFAIVFLISRAWDQQLTLAQALAPLALAVATRAVGVAFEAVRARRSQTAGVIAAAGTLAVVSLACVGVFAVGNGVPLVGTTVLGVLGTAVLWGVLCWIVARVWPELPASAAPADSARGAPRDDDEAWLRDLGQALRRRGDVSDARVGSIQAEAFVHAREAGRPLREEFGAPVAYAASFGTDPLVSSRRTAWWATAVALGVIGFAVWSSADAGALNGWGAAWAALTTLAALLAWREVVRHRR